MLKVLSLFGTRPEAIKMAQVVKALERFPGRFLSKVCVTAQHRQMLDQVPQLFEIVPDHHIDIMTPGQNLFGVTCNVYHLQGQTAKKDSVPARIEYWTSRYRYFRKNAPAVVRYLLAAGLFAKLCGSCLLQLVASPASSRARMRLRVSVSLLVWHLAGCPAGRGLAPGRCRK